MRYQYSVDSSWHRSEGISGFQRQNLDILSHVETRHETPSGHFLSLRSLLFGHVIMAHFQTKADKGILPLKTANEHLFR